MLALVAEKQLGTARVELKVVDLGVVGDGAHTLTLAEVLDADCHLVEQVGDDFDGLSADALRLRVVQARRDNVGVDVLSAASANHFVHAVFNNGKLARVEDHADLGVREVKLFVSTSSPRQLRDFAALHVAEENCRVGHSHHEAVLVDVDLLDLVLRLQHNTLLAFEALHDDLTKGNVGEFELALVPTFLEAHIKVVDTAAKRADSNFGAVVLPGH